MEQENNIEQTEQASPSTNMGEKIRTNLTMPMAILIAGVIIALAIVLSGGNGDSRIKNNSDKLTVKDASELRNLSPINSTDHIRGNINKAKVVVVEFSDLECPYCKQIHPTLVKMMEVYGEDVAWVYRHFPLESIHPSARPAAHASECAAELGGNDAFWKFTDGIFNSAETTPLETESLSNLATSIGIDKSAFDACQASGKHNTLIDANIEDAMNAGAQGTPDMTVVNLGSGEAVHVGADARLLIQVIDQMTQ